MFDCVLSELFMYWPFRIAHDCACEKVVFEFCEFFSLRIRSVFQSTPELVTVPHSYALEIRWSFFRVHSF